MGTNPAAGLRGPGRDVVVIGGSRGSLDPLQRLVAGLPPELEASVFVVQHRGSDVSTLETVLGRVSSLPVQPAVDGTVPVRGRVYVAPPDRHLFLMQDKMRVLFGPRENLSRPSIDVLFRSAAIAHGSSVIGVILSGALSDGAAGVSAVRRCGGASIAQDPREAADSELPLHAVNAGAEHQLPAAQLGAFIADLVRARRPPSARVPADLELEGRAALSAMMDPTRLVDVGERTPLSCPECMGPLGRLGEGTIARFRCHVGHSFTMDSLVGAQGAQLENALWVAYRTLLERGRMLENLIKQSGDRHRPHMTRGYERRLVETLEHVETIRRTLSAVQAPESPDAGIPGDTNDD